MAENDNQQSTRSLTLLERETLLFQDPNLLDKITRHVSSGGSVIELAELWKVNFADIMRWIRSDSYRNDQYKLSLIDRDEWSYERILMELKRIGTVDIRDLYDDKGNLKPVADWPDHAAGAVAGVDVFEVYEMQGRERVHTGDIKKVKLIDKIKALELHGKTMKMFTDRVETTTSLKLEDLVFGSFGETKKPIQKQQQTLSKSDSLSTNVHSSNRNGGAGVSQVQEDVQGDEDK